MGLQHPLLGDFFHPSSVWDRWSSLSPWLPLTCFHMQTRRDFPNALSPVSHSVGISMTFILKTQIWGHTDLRIEPAQDLMCNGGLLVFLGSPSEVCLCICCWGLHWLPLVLTGFKANDHGSQGANWDLILVLQSGCLYFRGKQRECPLAGMRGNRQGKHPPHRPALSPSQQLKQTISELGYVSAHPNNLCTCSNCPKCQVQN